MQKAADKSYREIYDLKNKGRYAVALSKLFESNGRPCAQFSHDMNHFYYVVGDILFKMKRYKEAKIAFKKAVTNWPKDAQALFAIAHCCELLKQPGTAMKWYSRSLASKYSAEAAYNFANLLLDSGRETEAWLILSRIQSADPSLVKQARTNAQIAKEKLRDKYFGATPSKR